MSRCKLIQKANLGQIWVAILEKAIVKQYYEGNYNQFAEECSLEKLLKIMFDKSKIVYMELMHGIDKGNTSIDELQIVLQELAEQDRLGEWAVLGLQEEHSLKNA